MPYRAVVRHVRYWRGVIHRWSTVYPFLGTPSSGLATSDAQLVLAADDKMCWGAAASFGGTYECALYDQATGGVPIVVYTAFDWTTVSTWIKHNGSGWTTPVANESTAEPALAVTWAAGLSSTGKPVKLRKWYHAVPSSSASSPGQPDINAGSVTSLTAAANAITGVLSAKGLALGSPTGRFAGSAHVSNFYENHQMPRGRRRKALLTAGGIWTGPRVPTIPGPPLEA